MKTIEIMTPDPQCVGPDDTLTQAARHMKACNVGILPVCRHGRLIGVLTDRDIAIRAVANGLDPGRVTVNIVMSRLIISCFADQDQEEAASMMESHHVRRLPVLDREERRIGIMLTPPVRPPGQAGLVFRAARRRRGSGRRAAPFPPPCR